MSDLTVTWWSTDDNTGTEIWMGQEREIEFFEAHEGWYPLYHEEDYQGIADQLLAEELYDI